MTEKVLKIAGLGLTLAGAAVSAASNFVDDKKLDIKVAEQVKKALEQVNK